MKRSSKHSQPPRFAIWLLESFCSYDYLATALWDLEELFDYHLAEKGSLKAKWWYFKEALGIIIHLYFKGQSRYSLNINAMFKNNIIIALRNFKKRKNYTLLNLLGLTTGLVIFLLITQYTTFEFSYDTHHDQSDRIYRVYKKVNGLEELYFDSGTPGLLAETMVNEYPEIEEAARFSKNRNQLVSANQKKFVEKAVYYVDPSVFHLFSFNVLHGSNKNPLAEGASIAISETIAKKYFGRTNVINETILVRNKYPFAVSAVYEDMPATSHFQMDLIVNFDWTIEAFDRKLDNWNNNPFFTYVLLKKGTDASTLEEKLPNIRTKYANDPEDVSKHSVTYYLEPLTDVHFSQQINWSMGTVADASNLHIFNAIAFIVLLMACINYINLATARSLVRIKETGIRKIMGAKRYSLLSQFLIESGILVFFALFLAVILVKALLPAFSSYLEKPIPFDLVSPILWLKGIALGLFITVLSGLYPALVTSSFNPLEAVSRIGKFQHPGYVRNVLVVVQFGLSAILITSAIVLRNQLSFIQNVDTGYTREQVMILSTRDNAVDDKLATYMEEIAKVTGVEAVATSWSLPTNVTSNTQANWPGIDDAQRLQMYMLGVTYDFFDLYQIEVIQGRAFDQEISSDKLGIILNETAVNAFGWEQPIGREMILENGQKGLVIGVVKDFNIKSLREQIQPLQIVLNPDYARLAVRVSGDLPKIMEDIENIYESFDPTYPFDYQYFDDIYQDAYVEGSRTGELIFVFSVLAVLIACLGLYGLAAHKVALRIKELGVRKVMGANAASIAWLLFKDFIVLIAIASFIAMPIAYVLLSNWLDSYAYHIQLDSLPFIMTVLIMIGFAAITVGRHTFQASVSNPILALRDE